MFRFYRKFCAARESANAWHKHRRLACGDPKTIQGRLYLIRSDHMQTLLAVGAGSLQPAGSTVDRAIIASFDQHVRLERSDQLFGCRLVEDHDDDDAGQAGQRGFPDRSPAGVAGVRTSRARLTTGTGTFREILRTWSWT
jgi:hypothetical protein